MALLMVGTFLLAGCAAPGDVPAVPRIDETPAASSAAPEPTVPEPLPTTEGCAALPYADAMAAAVGASEPPKVDSGTLEAIDDRLIVACKVFGPGKKNWLFVQYRLDAPCVPKPAGVGTQDSEVAGATYFTATNGGLAYSLCAPSGAEINVSYISFVDVPAPDLTTVRELALAAVSSETLLADIGRAALQ